MTARQLVPPVVRVAEDNDDEEDDDIDLRLELDDDDDFAIVKGDYASGEDYRAQDMIMSGGSGGLLSRLSEVAKGVDLRRWY